MIQGDENGVVFKDWAYQEWLSKYGVKPPWGVKDWANLQRALERFDDPGAAREAWRVYLTNEEPFFKGHSPSKFLLELGRFVRKAPPIVVVTEQIAKMASDRVAIMREIYTSPDWAGKTEKEKRDEYARRVKEL